MKKIYNFNIAGLKEIEGLDFLKELRALYLQEN